MVTDQEPRYRLVDADGNVVGSLFAESDGTLKLQEGTSGNDNKLSLTTQGALEVEQLLIGGKLYIREGTINVSNTTSTTFNLSTSSSDVLIIPAHDGKAGFNELQINGDTGANYDTIGIGDSSATTGQNQWSIPFQDRTTSLHLMVRKGTRTYLNVNHGSATGGVTLAGENNNVTSDISQFTLSDEGGIPRSLVAQVYRRDMS